MPRDTGLALVQNLAKLQHRQLLVGQQGEDTQARRLARRAQHIDRLVRRKTHERIKISLCLYVK